MNSESHYNFAEDKTIMIMVGLMVGLLVAAFDYSIMGARFNRLKKLLIKQRNCQQFKISDGMPMIHALSSSPKIVLRMERSGVSSTLMIM